MALCVGALAADGSPPSRGRELKLHAAADIAKRLKSPPSRGRELKLELAETRPELAGSPPSRGRELKRRGPVPARGPSWVAPLAGA